jgi:lysophospholipase
MTLFNEIKFDHLSHYKKVVETYADDPWRHDRISPRTFMSMLESFDYVYEQADKIDLPLLLQQAGDDLIVSQKRAEEIFERMKMKDKTQIVYEGFYHEIYNEVWRERVYADLLKWLDKHRLADKS